MDDKMHISNIGTTKLEKGKFIFSSFAYDEDCCKFVERMVEFIGDKNMAVLEDVPHLVGVAMEGLCPARISEPGVSSR